jgi:hypothetical protein
MRPEPLIRRRIQDPDPDPDPDPDLKLFGIAETGSV